MKKPQWIDATSYSRNETSKNTVPRSWALGVGHLSRIRVHRHRDDPSAWFLTCYALSIEQACLKAKELEDAKVEALAIVAKKIKDILGYYKKLGIEV